MKQSPEAKAAKARQRLIDVAAQYAVGTYCRRFEAPLFQKMIRAEAAAMQTGYTNAIDPDTRMLIMVYRHLGECVCVTCGKVYPWSGTNMLDTGHFVASRRNSILLVEQNCEPQCKHCNRDHHGRPLEFRMWMQAVRGDHVIEWLQELKTKSVAWTREELVDMRIEFTKRLKDAEQRMNGTT